MSIENPLRNVEGNTYRGSTELVSALSRNFEIPDAFFNVHESAKRGFEGKDIQDPEVWLKAVRVKDGSPRLSASLDFTKGFYKFVTDGNFPENLTPNSKAGVLAELILGEAKLQAIQKVMPEAYASGRGRVEAAIKETRELRRVFVNNLDNPQVKDLKSLMEKRKTSLPKLTPMKLVPALGVLALAISACQSGPGAVITPISPESGTTPTATQTVEVIETNAPTQEPTKEVSPTPEIKFERVTNFEQKGRMETITPEDLKPGSEFSKWEQEQIDKMGPLTSDPSRIDFRYWTGSNNVQMLIVNDLDHNHGIRNTEFFSYYKINLGPWGFPDKTAYVVTYAWEDKNGDKTPVHFLLTEKQVNDLRTEKGGLDTDPRGHRLIPTDKINPGGRDTYLIDGKPNGPNDLRSMADIFYENQGYTKKEVQDLFQRIASSDTISGEDKEMLQKIIFFGPDNRVIN